MSRRHDPDRKSRRTAKPDDAEDLPTLESIAEELEQVAAADQVKVAPQATAEPGFDVAFTVEVAAMDKKAMPEAVAAALQPALVAAAAQVRNHRVLVAFLGDTLIGTAVKDTVGTALKAARARKIVVRRGYGDELLHDVPPPRAAVEKTTVGDTVRVAVTTGDLEAADLPAALQPELVALASAARGLRFQFTFQGAARPDAALRDLLARTLGDAGALRAAIGERVLFDRELEARVRVSARGDDVAIEITPADREAETLDAIAMVLPDAHERLAGKVVALRFARPTVDSAVQQAIAECRRAAPRRLEVDRGDGQGVDVVLPPLLEVESRATGVRVRIVGGGRSGAAVAVAFAREARELGATVQGKAVEVDIGGDVALDPPAVDGLLQRAVAVWAPASLACSRAGGEAEPIWPAPFTVTSAAGAVAVRIDTDACKPAHLLAAIERRLPVHLAAVRGGRVHCTFVGASAPSRGLLRAVAGLAPQFSLARLEVEQQGTVDVVAPPLLAVSARADGVGVRAATAGREPAQLEVALQRELAAFEWNGKTVTIAGAELVARLHAATVERGAAKVFVDAGDGAVLVHPPLLTASVQAQQWWITAAPLADAATVRRQIARELPALLATAAPLPPTLGLVWPGGGVGDEPVSHVLAQLVAAGAARVLFDGGHGRSQVHPPLVLDYVAILGRKDDGPAPLLMLAVDAGATEEHAQRLRDRLQELAPQLADRRVLLVSRRDGEELAADDAEPAFALVRAFVEPLAAATLVFRGRDGRARPHFTVVATRTDGIAVGQAFADPRPRS